jgi:phage gpG-like protein
MTSLTFKGWGKFRAKKQPDVIKRWLGIVRSSSQDIFTRGMKGPHNGMLAKRKDGSIFHRSTPSQFPAVDSGMLLASLKTRQTIDSATIGTNMFYAKFLRTGTRLMKRRKMSDNAIRTGGTIARPASKGWVAWQRSR